MAESVTITAIIIAKNEAELIPLCLSGLSWVDEIIVIDNISSDETVSLAKKAGAKVFTVSSNDFSVLRTAGLHHARGTWVLYIDADERVTPALKQEILGIIAAGEKAHITGYYVQRNNIYLGHPWPTRDKMQRLFLKNAFKGWHGKLHESAEIEGSYGTLTEPLLHYTHRSLEQMAAKTNEWSEVEADLRLQAHHPPVVWWRLIRVFVTGFFATFVAQKGWKAGTVGWIESIYQGFSYVVTYAKLWEKQQTA